MIKIMEQFEELKLAKGKDKQRILEQYKDDVLFKKTLHFFVDTMNTTGIASSKINNKKLNENAQNETEKEGFDISDGVIKTFENLIDTENGFFSEIKNTTGSHEVISEILKFAFSFKNDNVVEFVKDLVVKKNIGISKKTINKVYGKDFVFDWQVMLAESFDKRADKLEQEMENGTEIIMTTKLDGFRCTIVKDDGEFVVRKRSGQKIEYFEQYEELIKDINKMPDGVYDGELLLNRELYIDYDIKNNSEAFNRTVRIINNEKTDKNELMFYCFDYLPVDEFYEGKSKENALIRKNRVIRIKEKCKTNVFVDVPILYVGSDFDKISELLKEQVEKGEEGVMINYLEAMYETKRVKSLLKVKQKYNADVMCVGIYKGDEMKEFSDTLGGITVIYKGKETNVGSGFKKNYSDKYDNTMVRDFLFYNKDEIIGKIVNIEFTEEQKDKDGNISPRFARFKGIRNDKTEESYEI